MTRMQEEAVVHSFFTSRLYRHPKSQAVLDWRRQERYTYGDLAQRANRLAVYLKEELAIQKGDRVAICAPNHMVYIDLFYATPWTGAITTSYNGMMLPKELEAMMFHELPRVLFYDPDFKEKIDCLRHCPALVNVVWIPLDGTYDEIVTGAARPLDPVPIGLEDIIMLMHTGGTTGKPKGAMLSARAVMLNAIGQQNTYGLTGNDVMYGYLPFFHTATWHTIVMPLLYAGGRLVFSPKFHAKEMLDVITRERPTMVWGVPTVYRRLAEHPDFDKTDFSSITRCRCGAAPPPLDLMERYWAKGIQFCNGYGMTETSPGNLSIPVGELSLEELKAKRTSCGKVMPYNEAKIIGPDGQEVAVGEKGELLLRGGVLFSGYWKDEAATQKAMPDGWMHTGDVAQQDEDGFFYVVGRLKNMYISNGENIFPSEIEAALFCHSAVQDVCVIGVPDALRGEVGKAVIVCRDGMRPSVEELRRFASEHLASIQCPVYYAFVSEIPKTSLGKVELEKLRQTFGYPENGPGLSPDKPFQAR